ncbi:hypothetical protein Daesc_007839 [Daldinia eschscholtzii]|uniref:2EXR domain-containing protein n=1 Tax=Daldinia eschscholtzii TaxID=292717 RepID=A0AAX6MFV8_9PEZI
MEGSGEIVPTFTRFSDLSPELRHMVWELCLPSRLVQMHDSAHRKNQSCRPIGRPHTTPPSLPVPPMIAHVCRESRAIALMHGRVEETAFWETPVWFNRKTDRIHLDEDYYRQWSLRDEDTEPQGMEILAYDRSIPLSIERTIVLGHNPLYPIGSEYPIWALERLVEREECDVVLAHTTMFMKHEHAVESGLFGNFAEESPAFINVKDAKQIAALVATCDMVPVRRSSTRNAGLFQVKEDIVKGYMMYYIVCFLKCVRTLWLKINGALRYTFDPWSFTKGMENRERYQRYLQRLPKFNYVVAVHLSKTKPRALKK